MITASEVKVSRSKKRVLAAIDEAIAACQKSQLVHSNVVVAEELDALQTIAAAVRLEWPLSSTFKNKINVGPVAAKNIDDWNPSLASILMRLDYALRHEGSGLESTSPAEIDLETSVLHA